MLPQPKEGPPEPEPREHLLGGVLKFTRTAASMASVKRIALLGSLTRGEPDPKDADVLVVVTDAMDLAPLAKAGRQLAGHAQRLNRGADVFPEKEIATSTKARQPRSQAMFLKPASPSHARSARKRVTARTGAGATTLLSFHR